MTHWGMVVDLGRCVGCQTCTIACKMENGLPPSTLWRTVLDLESGEYPDVNRQFLPMTCMQCADPPCYDACPTTATKVRPDGIVWIDNDICIGCGSCVVACPYRARHLISEEKYYFGEATPPELATYDRKRVGICTKCHFCYHKFDNAPEGARPGIDPEYTPACSSSCIADAIIFGDWDDPDSRVSRLADSNPTGLRLLEHLETKPSVVYLNPPRIEPRAPELQQTWHGLATANFFCGTTGMALFILGTICGWLGTEAYAPLFELADKPGSPGVFSIGGFSMAAFNWRHLTGLLGPALVAIGLLSVAAEAGRPFRGFNVIRNFRNSWMSRESVFAIAFIVLAGLDTLLLASPVVQTLAGMTGLGLALCQGLILRTAKGVPAWSVPIMPHHFAASGLASGMGAYLIVAGLFHSQILIEGISPYVVGLGLIALNLAIWWRYLTTPPHTPTFTRSVEVLRRPSYLAGIVGLGGLLPAMLLVAGLVSAQTVPAAPILAGAAMLTGGLIAKIALIQKAAFWVDLFDKHEEQRAAVQDAAPQPAAEAA
ncbi:MAG: DmsC/YnfH family molybdoenzyme membrane anchor subunit [bacterium]